MPAKRMKTVSAVNSSNKAVQAIVTQLTTLSAELDELRGRPTDEVLAKRAQELQESIDTMKNFKTKLEDLCQRVQSDLEDLFCDHRWARFDWK